MLSCLVALLLLGSLAFMIQKEQAGEPLFAPVANPVIGDEKELAVTKENEI